MTTISKSEFFALFQEGKVLDLQAAVSDPAVKQAYQRAAGQVSRSPQTDFGQMLARTNTRVVDNRQEIERVWDIIDRLDSQTRGDQSRESVASGPAVELYRALANLVKAPASSGGTRSHDVQVIDEDGGGSAGSVSIEAGGAQAIYDNIEGFAQLTLGTGPLQWALKNIGDAYAANGRRAAFAEIRRQLDARQASFREGLDPKLSAEERYTECAHQGMLDLAELLKADGWRAIPYQVDARHPFPLAKFAQYPFALIVDSERSGLLLSRSYVQRVARDSESGETYLDSNKLHDLVWRQGELLIPPGAAVR